MAAAAIVIVTYNSAAHIGACLDAALGAGVELVVIDNASSDATVKEVTRRGVRLIANSENRGFATAVNQGIECVGAPNILLLNPDAVLLEGLDALCAACDLPRTAGAGGRLLSLDGRPQIGFMVRRLPTAAALAMEALLLNRLWPNNPINRRYRALDLDYTARHEIEQPAGAFLMIRRDVWQKLGGFDEKFHPLWFEDVDFCRRAVDAGYCFRYVPEAVAKHTGGHSIPGLPVEVRSVYWYGSFLRYTGKHFRRGQIAVVCLAVAVGSAVRGIFDSLTTASLRPLAAYREILRIACRTFGARAAQGSDCRSGSTR